MDKILQPYQSAVLQLQNCMVMAPMTRSRADISGNIPNELMAEYYAQRASAGLIITEATQVSVQGQGYARTPGIYSSEQVERWKKVTQAVHDKGSKIFLQLWHVGRVSSMAVSGMQPLAPSAISARETQVYIFDDTAAQPGEATFISVDQPRAMEQEDIRQTIEDFRCGALNAITAGFDGVEIHGANGYLIDQFLRSNSNQRHDEYGGSRENRVRFLLEVTEAVVAAVGKGRVGVRLSPYIRFKDMNDPEILETIQFAVSQLAELDIAYLHMCEADWDDAPSIPLEFRRYLRRSFPNTIIVAGNQTKEIAEDLLGANLINLAAFGRKFLANPDLPKRFALNRELNPIIKTHHIFGGGGAEGYTDYPLL